MLPSQGRFRGFNLSERDWWIIDVNTLFVRCSGFTCLLRRFSCINLSLSSCHPLSRLVYLITLCVFIFYPRTILKAHHGTPCVDLRTIQRLRNGAIPRDIQLGPQSQHLGISYSCRWILRCVRDVVTTQKFGMLILGSS